MNSKEKAEEIARKLELPRCPECGEKISELYQKSDVTEVFRFCIDDKGSISYTQVDTYGGRNIGYFCPACNEKIASTEKEAEELLRGEISGGEQGES